MYLTVVERLLEAKSQFQFHQVYFETDRAPKSDNLSPIINHYLSACDDPGHSIRIIHLMPGRIIIEGRPPQD